MCQKFSSDIGCLYIHTSAVTCFNTRRGQGAVRELGTMQTRCLSPFEPGFARMHSSEVVGMLRLCIRLAVCTELYTMIYDVRKETNGSMEVG
jgi:hypothetical protein